MRIGTTEWRDPLADALARRWPTLRFVVHPRLGMDDVLAIDVESTQGRLGRVLATRDELLAGFNVVEAVEALLRSHDA